MTDRRSFLRQAGLIALDPWLARAKPEHPAGLVTLENSEMRLVVGADGAAVSLVHKSSGQECLAPQERTPMFGIVQYRPYDNELQLSYPARPRTFPCESVRREGDRLIVEFATVGYEAAIVLNVTDAYIGFTVAELKYTGYTNLRAKRPTPVDEFVFLQLPLKARKNFGEWLNVAWDEAVAVNVLGTGPDSRIDSIACGDRPILRASAVNTVKMLGVGGALIVTSPDRLLDRIDQLEKDYQLPRGVEARRRKQYRQSYYELLSTRPEDIERHIHFARMAGLRSMDVYYRVFTKTAGHFPWRAEYPQGIEDVKRLIGQISEAGITPGIHIHYNKADKRDAYVTPQPDPRLHWAANFTLREPLDTAATMVTVDQNPRTCTLDAGRRILMIQEELISYERYTATQPYQFLGCQRGALGTRAASHPQGTPMGLLDVDTWPEFVRFTQDTGLQEEVARRLAAIYHGAGFRFVYFDGAEDVPGPEYWYTVSRAQWLVYRALDPPPLFAEGACKSHFSWHILSRGNAFDVFRPEVLKAAIRAYPAKEASLTAKDFTSINFGWLGYWAPGKETIGTQPDMLEYATSRAAAWDCPVSLVGDLPQLEAHPRTPDNLEVIRRWEEVRAQEWLSAEQKRALRNLDQEHTLLINEQGLFELAPCTPVERVAGQDRPARAFVFERNGKACAAFWHTSGEALLELPLRPEAVRLMYEFGKPQRPERSAIGIRAPLGRRIYLECGGMGKEELIAAFRNAKIRES